MKRFLPYGNLAVWAAAAPIAVAFILMGLTYMMTIIIAWINEDKDVVVLWIALFFLVFVFLMVIVLGFAGLWLLCFSCRPICINEHGIIQGLLGWSKFDWSQLSSYGIAPTYSKGSSITGEQKEKSIYLVFNSTQEGIPNYSTISAIGVANLSMRASAQKHGLLWLLKLFKKYDEAAKATSNLGDMYYPCDIVVMEYTEQRFATINSFIKRSNLSLNNNG